MVHRTKISKCSERLVNRLKNTGGGMQLKNYSLAGKVLELVNYTSLLQQRKISK